MQCNAPPQPSEGSCHLLILFPTCLHRKRQRSVPFSRRPTRSASGCPGAWGCHLVLMCPSSSLMQMTFLRSSFWHVSEALVCHLPCSKTRQSFEALPSSAGFIENLLKPSLAPGFVVRSPPRRKSAVGGSLGLMTAQSFLSLYGSSRSLPYSQNCAVTFL